MFIRLYDSFSHSPSLVLCVFFSCARLLVSLFHSFFVFFFSFFFLAAASPPPPKKIWSHTPTNAQPTPTHCHQDTTYPNRKMEMKSVIILRVTVIVTGGGGGHVEKRMNPKENERQREHMTAQISLRSVAL